MHDVLHSPVALGRNLRLLRQAREKRLDEAARASGISKSYLSLIEHGKRTISFEILYKLLRFYNYSLGQFISEAQHHNEAEGPYFQPSAAIQTPKHHLLLAGSRLLTQPTLLLLRPLRSSEDLELLRLFLPPHSYLPEHCFFSTPAMIRGYVLQGNFLIECSDASEMVLRHGEEFETTFALPFRFRNYTDNDAEALLVIAPPWL